MASGVEGCGGYKPDLLYDRVLSTCLFFFFSSRRRHTILQGDWSSDVCSSDLENLTPGTEGRTIGSPPRPREARGIGADTGWAPEKPRSEELTMRPAAHHLSIRDRKSTRLNSSHLVISYAVFCLKKKTTKLSPISESCRGDFSHFGRYRVNCSLSSPVLRLPPPPVAGLTLSL